jgi:ABC-type phosphate transport system ATPase subunit
LENANIIYNYNKQLDIVVKKKQEWSDLIFFNNVFNKSISDMMMYTLNTINFTVQKYIQGFFDKDVQFTFSFNNDKNCIDVNVTPDISILSGGEYDRLVLAIVLAFSEFFKLPFLFLDEIVNSLDIYTTQKVVQFIQQHYPANQTIIYVGHQMIRGMFDSIICLDESTNEN